MKINLVKDKSGKVIATFEAAKANGPSVAPQIDPALHSLQEVDVADNYLQSIDAVYAQHSK